MRQIPATHTVPGWIIWMWHILKYATFTKTCMNMDQNWKTIDIDYRYVLCIANVFPFQNFKKYHFIIVTFPVKTSVVQTFPFSASPPGRYEKGPNSSEKAEVWNAAELSCQKLHCPKCLGPQKPVPLGQLELTKTLPDEGFFLTGRLSKRGKVQGPIFGAAHFAPSSMFCNVPQRRRTPVASNRDIDIHPKCTTLRSEVLIVKRTCLNWGSEDVPRGFFSSVFLVELFY